MKRIFFLLLLFIACTEPDDEIVKKQEYTFFVYAADQKEFTALIEWGVNGLQERERVTTFGFASSVELYPDDELGLQADQDLVVRVTENKIDKTGQVYGQLVGVYELTAGNFQAIKPQTK